MLADKGDYKTSTACIFEVAKGDLDKASYHKETEELQGTWDHTAPLSLSGSQTTGGVGINGRDDLGGRSVGDQPASTPKTAGSQGAHGPVSVPSASSSTSSLVQPGNQTGAGDGEVISKLLDGGSEAFGKLSSLSSDLHRIVHTIERGKHVLQKYGHTGKGSDSIRRIFISTHRANKAFDWLSEKTDLFSQSLKLASNLHASKGKFHQIMNSSAPIGEKAGRIGAEIAAKNLQTIAEIGLEGLDDTVEVSRAIAAMAGVDVSHPSFGERSIYDPRSYLSLQSLNFFSVRLSYLARTVYTGDHIYVLFHADVTDKAVKTAVKHGIRQSLPCAGPRQF